MINVLISYRRDDSGHAAERVFERLQDRTENINAIMDVFSIPTAINYESFLLEFIEERADVVLAFIGDRWLTANENGKRRIDEPEDLLRRELIFSLKKRIPIIPVLVGRAQMPSSSELPEDLYVLE
jgi:hypothetical protein